MAVALAVLWVGLRRSARGRSAVRGVRDVVDASIGLYLLRRALGRSTLTRTERLRAAEDAARADDAITLSPAQLAARLGMTEGFPRTDAPMPARPAAAPAPARPLPVGDADYRARLERAAAASRSSVLAARPVPARPVLPSGAITRARVDRRRGLPPRLRLVRDASVALVLVALLAGLGATLAPTPAGDVLSASGTPAPTPSPASSPTPSPSLEPSGGPTPPP